MGTARVRVTYIARADLDGGRPPPDETPPEIASAVPAAPTGRVAAARARRRARRRRRAAGSGVVSLPAPPPVASADTAVATQPTGIVTEVPVPAATHLYVQAGAFSTYQNAARLQSRLGAGLEISSSTQGGRTIYRVRSGPFDDVGDADKALARVSSLGSNDAQIVVDR